MSPEAKERRWRQFEALNPVALQREMEELQRRLWRMSGERTAPTQMLAWRGRERGRGADGPRAPGAGAHCAALRNGGRAKLGAARLERERSTTVRRYVGGGALTLTGHPPY